MRTINQQQWQHWREQTWRWCMPILMLLIFVCIAHTPIPLKYYGNLSLNLTFSLIFYWAIYRPFLFKPIMLVGIGFFNDLLNIKLFGLTPLLYLLIFFSARQKRLLFNRLSLGKLMGINILMMFSIYCIEYTVFSIMHEGGVPWQWFDLLVRLLVTALCFPLMVWFVQRLQHTVPDYLTYHK